MTAMVFVDTNVLVYVRDRTEEEKQRRALEWMVALWDTGLGRLSYQVLKEYYVVATRKLDPPRSEDEAREDVLALTAWEPLVVDRAVMEEAWDIQDGHGFSWWDALIVAAGLRSRCRYLLTEDLQEGLEVDALTIVSPFTSPPDAILPV